MVPEASGAEDFFPSPKRKHPGKDKLPDAQEEVSDVQGEQLERELGFVLWRQMVAGQPESSFGR